MLGSSSVDAGVGPTPYLLTQRTLGPRPTPLSLACAAFFVILTACSTRCSSPMTCINPELWFEGHLCVAGTASDVDFARGVRLRIDAVGAGYSDRDDLFAPRLHDPKNGHGALS